MDFWFARSLEERITSCLPILWSKALVFPANIGPIKSSMLPACEGSSLAALSASSVSAQHRVCYLAEFSSGTWYSPRHAKWSSCEFDFANALMDVYKWFEELCIYTCPSILGFLNRYHGFNLEALYLPWNSQKSWAVVTRFFQKICSRWYVCFSGGNAK